MPSAARDAADLFELPSAGATGTFELHSPWRAEAGQPVLKIRAGTPQTFHLQPFEVLTLETR